MKLKKLGDARGPNKGLRQLLQILPEQQRRCGRTGGRLKIRITPPLEPNPQPISQPRAPTRQPKQSRIVEPIGLDEATQPVHDAGHAGVVVPLRELELDAETRAQRAAGIAAAARGRRRRGGG